MRRVPKRSAKRSAPASLALWLRRWLALRRSRPPLQQRRPVLQSGSCHAGRARRHALPLQARWLRLSGLAWPVLQTLMLLRRTLPLLWQAVLPLQARLPRRVVARIIVSRRIGLPQRALLRDDLPPDALGGVDLAHDALIAQRLLRRNRQRCRGEAAAGAGADRKAAGALRERTEPRAAAVVDVDMPDPAVRIGIELDRDIVGARGRRILRHFDQAGGAANAQRRSRRRYFHVTGLRNSGGNKCHRAPGDIEHRGVLLAAVLVDIIVDRNRRIGGEIEGGGVVEGDAERGIGRGLQHVVEIDVVLHFERRGRVVAGDGGGAGQRRDVPDRLGGGCCLRGGGGGGRGGG